MLDAVGMVNISAHDDLCVRGLFHPIGKALFPTFDFLSWLRHIT